MKAPPWVIALAVTLALHTSLLVAFAWSPRREVAPMTVTTPHRTVDFTRVSVLPRAAPPTAAPPAASARSVPGRTARPVAPTEEPALLSAGDGTEATMIADAPIGSPTSDSAPGEAAPAGDSRPAAPRIDLDALLHSRLTSAAAQCYPAAAKRFRQQGVVELAFCADGAGVLSGAEVKHSSGSELLDRAATECVLARASPFPAGATGRCFSLPVRFGFRAD